MAQQPTLTKYEDYVDKIFKLIKPGPHGEGARYKVLELLEMKHSTNAGGLQKTFKVKRLEPEGEFFRACSLFKDQFILADAKPSGEFETEEEEHEHVRNKWATQRVVQPGPAEVKA